MSAGVGEGRTSMKVAVLMGSPRDRDKMAPAAEMLERLGLGADVRVLSAHRTPDEVADFARSARQEGFAAVICGAGLAAHLAGAVAAHTTLPVIGVPLSGGALGGVDALYATVQMPRGVPVATVAIDGAANAAILAAEMVAITDSDVSERLDQLRAEWGQTTAGGGAGVPAASEEGGVGAPPGAAKPPEAQS
ncbi:MAG: 5-(carboxyamino)imidazole ribonucleotide mutase [Acidimicrobiales bacterium]|nr:MAG: 5-(carboxyamino)imidazole ribonucleotide mutase [Acidimicrobiales bacterium]